MTSAREIFEGSFGKLKFLYDKITSENKPPQTLLFPDIIEDVKYDFSHVGSVFFESNLPHYNLNEYSSDFQKEGIELFYISAKSKLKYQNKESES